MKTIEDILKETETLIQKEELRHRRAVEDILIKRDENIDKSTTKIPVNTFVYDNNCSCLGRIGSYSIRNNEVVYWVNGNNGSHISYNRFQFFTKGELIVKKEKELKKLKT